MSLNFKLWIFQRPLNIQDFNILKLHILDQTKVKKPTGFLLPSAENKPLISMELEVFLLMSFFHSMKMQVPQATTNVCLEQEKSSSVLTSTQTNIIILLLTGLVRDVGLYYCDRKMIEQEVHCRYQLICKALQSCRLLSFHCSSLQRPEY